MVASLECKEPSTLSRPSYLTTLSKYQHMLSVQTNLFQFYTIFNSLLRESSKIIGTGNPCL